MSTSEHKRSGVRVPELSLTGDVPLHVFLSAFFFSGPSLFVGGPPCSAPLSISSSCTSLLRLNGNVCVPANPLWRNWSHP